MRTLKRVAVCSLGLVVSIIVFVMYSSSSTEEDIARLRARVANLAAKRVAPDYDPAGFASLPEPVKRYFAFVFRGAPPPCSVVRLKAEGAFRRPLTHDFAPTTAEQVIAVGTPSW